MMLVMSCAKELMQDPFNAALSDEEFDSKAEQTANSEYQQYCVKHVEDFASHCGITPPRCVRVSSK
jgi:hypothetical protein